MNAADIFAQLSKRNIRLHVENGALKFRCPKNAMTVDLRQLIADNKAEIISAIHSGKYNWFSLSSNQQALWFLEETGLASGAYNVILSFKFSSVVDVNKLELAFNELLNAHSILRARYKKHQFVYQTIEEHKPVKIMQLAFSDSNDFSQSEDVRKSCYKKFDLAAENPVRCILFTGPDNNEYVSLNFHHIICDALSLKLLVSHFFSFYAGTEKQRLISDTWSKYTDYIDEQIILKMDQGLRTPHTTFWKNQLDKTEFVVNYPFPVQREYDDFKYGTQKGVFIGQELADRISAFAKRNNVTTTVIALVVYEITLRTKFQLDSCTIGLMSSGRASVAYKSTIGYFVNTLPISLKTDFKKSIHEICNALSEKVNTVQGETDYPFAFIVEDVNPARQQAANPIFQIAFNYLSYQALGDLSAFLVPVNDTVLMGGIEIEPQYLSQQNGQFDLTLEITEHRNGAYWNVKYKKNIFSEEIIDSFVELLHSNLNLIISNESLTGSEIISKNIPIKKDVPSSRKGNVAIASNFTIEPVEHHLRKWLYKAQIRSGIEFAPYNQIFQQLLDQNSILYSESTEYILLTIYLEDWLISTNGEIDNKKLTDVLEDFSVALHQFFQRCKTPVKIFFMPYSEKILNNPDLLIKLTNVEKDFVEKNSFISSITLSNEMLYYFSGKYYDPHSNKSAHIPFRSEFYSFMGAYFARKIWNHSRKPLKVIVLDCDETLWQGAVAEDGVDGISVGKEFRDFQNTLSRFEKNGAVLCLCSKNAEDDVINVFNTKKDMVLNIEQITVKRINWEAKYKNIISISQELDLGLESFIFIDDSPYECAEVKAYLPEVCVLNILKEDKNRNDILCNFWPIDSFTVPSKKLDRTRFYQENSKRMSLKSSSISLSDFIQKLELKVEIKAAEKSDVERVSELSFRVNQFNVTGKTFTVKEVSEYIENDKASVHITRASDKFGDYGVIGCIFANKRESVLIIENIFISCRALGKGIEAEMFLYIGSVAEQFLCDTVNITVNETGRNEPAKKMLFSLFQDYIKENSGINTMFEIPSSVISQLSFTNEIEEETKPNKRKKKPDIQSNFIDDSLFMNIAKELSSISTPAEKKKVNTSVDISYAVTTAWSDSLQISDIDMDINYFELGGTSLLIPEIISRLAENHQIEVEIIDFFKYSTLRTFIEYCERSQQAINVQDNFEDTDSQTSEKNIKELSLQDRFRRARRNN